jgi:deoxyribose-phosphate aldolase
MSAGPGVNAAVTVRPVWGRAASATAIGSVAGLTLVGFPHAAMAAVLAARVAARNVRRVNIFVPTL